MPVTECSNTVHEDAQPRGATELTSSADGTGTGTGTVTVAKRAGAAVDSSPHRKRAARSAHEWKLVFDQTQGLHCLVDVVANILKRIHFIVVRDRKQDATFLCIDSVNPEQNCLVQAKLLCDNADVADGTGTSFCVDSETLKKCLKNITNHYSLEIVKYRDSSDVQLKAYEPMSNSHSTSYTISTLLEEDCDQKFRGLEYLKIVEVDLGLLRGMIKVAKDLQSDVVELSVHEPREEQDGVMCSRFRIRSFGDATQEQSFTSSTAREAGVEADGPSIIRAVTDSSMHDIDNHPFDCVYKDTFSTEYMHLFLKSMDRQLIRVHLTPDQPLVLNYPIGPEASHINFVLAPRLGDEGQN